MSTSASAQPLDILRPRTADGWGLGLAMAAGVHLLLVGALALGVRWKMTNPEPVEAEVWAEVPTVAAPAAPVAPPEPPPTPPAPEPVVPPPPVPEPVKAVAPEPLPERVPDVVVAKVTKEERKKAKKKEPVEVFETTPPKPSKKQPKPEKVDKPEKVVAKVAEKPPVKVVEKTPAKVELQPKAKPSDNSAQAVAEREAQRRATLAKMMGELGSLGTSEQTGGPTAAYGGRIKARVKPNIVFTDNVSGNPVALVEVRCAPDGRIISRRLLKASGVAVWDEAVLRAVDRTEVLPANENGRVPPVIELEFRPNDF